MAARRWKDFIGRIIKLSDLFLIENFNSYKAILVIIGYLEPLIQSKQNL